MAFMRIYDDEVDNVLREWIEKKLGHKVDCVMVSQEKGKFPDTRAVRTYAYFDWKEPADDTPHANQ